MILKTFAIGFVMWLLATLAFRFAGHLFFTPDETGRFILFAVTAPVMALLTWVILKLLGEAAIDRGEAAIGLAAPGMLLDVYVTHEFATVFPNLDPTLDGPFGALLLLAYATIVVTGLFLTRLAPMDERL